MSDLTLTHTRLRAGIWEGVISGAANVPELQVMHLEKPVSGLRVMAVPNHEGTYGMSVPIPAHLLNDGIQTFVIQDKNDNTTLASFSIIAGTPLDHDLRAEIDLLRAELDLLKRAFRRHCVETA